MTLLVCRTCPRYDAATTGDFHRELSELGLADEVALRHVKCLGACPDAGAAAVESPGKARVRFSGLDPNDAGALVAAARAFDQSVTGLPGEWTVPASLRDRISSVRAKPSR